MMLSLVVLLLILTVARFTFAWHSRRRGSAAGSWSAQVAGSPAVGPEPLPW